MFGVSFKPHKYPVKDILFSVQYRLRNAGPEKLCNLAKISDMINGELNLASALIFDPQPGFVTLQEA